MMIGWRYETTWRPPALAIAGQPGLGAVLLCVVALRALSVALTLAVALAKGAGLAAFAHWDALYYAQLAQVGYRPYVFTVSHSGLAFLPLFPLVLSIPMRLGLSPDVAGFLVSNLCALAAFAGMAILVTRDFGALVAMRALVLLAAVPAALYLGMTYSESLYLALSVWGFVFLRRRRWLAAAILFGLTSATRPTGVFLAVPYLVELGLAWRQERVAVGRLLGAAALFVAPLCLVALYDLSIGAGPLAFLGVERTAWHYAWTWPWETIARHIAATAALGSAGHALLPAALLNLGAVVVALPLVIVGLRRLPASYALYALAVFLTVVAVCSSAPFRVGGAGHIFVMPLISAHRLLLVAFPLAVSAALVIRRGSMMLLTVVALSLLQALFTLFFVNGVWTG